MPWKKPYYIITLVPHKMQRTKVVDQLHLNNSTTSNKRRISTRRVLSGIAVLRFLRALVSLATVVASSVYFGTSIHRDIWVLTLTFTVIFSTCLFGPLGDIFRTKFVMIQENHGSDYAVKGALSLLNSIILICFAFVVAVELKAETIAELFAPGYHGGQTREFAVMLRVMAPAILIKILVEYWSGILNCFDLFYIPEYYGVFAGLLNISFIVVLAPRMGIYSLVISHYAGNIILVITLILILLKNGISVFRWVAPKCNLIKPYVAFALPFYVPFAIAQLVTASEKAMTTNLGTGNVSVLDYSRRFIDVPVSIIQSTISTVVAPILARVNAWDDKTAFSSESSQFLTLALLGALPVFALLFVCSGDLVHILLYRGNFGAEFVDPAGATIRWFSIGLIGVLVHTILNQGLMAQNRGKVVAIVQSTMGLGMLCFNYLLYRTYGVKTFAAVWSLGSVAIALASLFCIEKKLRSSVRMLLGRILPIYIGSVALAYLCRQLFVSSLNASILLTQITTVTFTVSVVCLTGLAGIYALKLEERLLITRAIKTLSATVRGQKSDVAELWKKSYKD